MDLNMHYIDLGQNQCALVPKKLLDNYKAVKQIQPGIIGLAVASKKLSTESNDYRLWPIALNKGAVCHVTTDLLDDLLEKKIIYESKAFGEYRSPFKENDFVIHCTKRKVSWWLAGISGGGS